MTLENTTCHQILLNLLNAFNKDTETILSLLIQWQQWNILMRKH
jgi:hypothetical protein